MVSTFLLVAGVAGANLDATDILLTAIAGAIAGAVSMSCGEYIATKSQNEVLTGEIKLEQSHIKNYQSDEIRELSGLLELIGIESTETQIRRDLEEYYCNHPDALLKIMVALEFGVVKTEERSPLRAGVFSGASFVFGSLPSVLPFIAGNKASSTALLIIAALLTCACLLVVGIVKTWVTRGHCIRASIENLVIAGFGGTFAYGIGVLYEMIVNGDE